MYSFGEYCLVKSVVSSFFHVKLPAVQFLKIHFSYHNTLQFSNMKQLFDLRNKTLNKPATNQIKNEYLN